MVTQPSNESPTMSSTARFGKPRGPSKKPEASNDLLETELGEARARIKELEAENAKLQSEANRFRRLSITNDKDMQMEHDFQQLWTKFVTTEAELTRRETEYGELHTNHQILEGRLKEAEQFIKHKDDLLENSEKRIVEVESAYTTLEEGSNAESMRKLEDEVDELRQRHKSVRKAFESADIQLTQKESEVAQLKEAVAKQEAAAASEQEEKRQFKEQVATANAKVQKMKHEVQKMKKEKKREDKDMSDQFASFGTRRSHKTAEAGRAFLPTPPKSSAQGDSDEEDIDIERPNLAEAFTGKNSIFEGPMAETTEHETELEKALGEKSKALEKVEETMERQSKALKEAETALNNAEDTVKDKHKALEDEKATSEKTIRQLQERIAELEAQKKIQTDYANGLKHKRDELEQALEDKSKALGGAAAKWEKEVPPLQKRIKGLEAHVEKLQTALNTSRENEKGLSGEIEELKKEKNASYQKIETLNRDLEGLKGQNASQDELVISLRKGLIILKQQLDETKDASEVSQKEMEVLRKRIEEFKGQKVTEENFANSLKEERDVWMEESEKLKEEIRVFKGQLDEAKESLNKREVEAKKILDRNTQLMQNKISKVRKAWEENVKELQQRNNKANIDIIDRDTTIRNLEEDKASLKHRLLGQNRLKQENKELTQQLNESYQSSLDLVASVSHKSKEIEKLKQGIRTLIESCEAEKAESISKYEEKVKELQDQIESLRASAENQKTRSPDKTASNYEERIEKQQEDIESLKRLLAAERKRVADGEKLTEKHAGAVRELEDKKKALESSLADEQKQTANVTKPASSNGGTVRQVEVEKVSYIDRPVYIDDSPAQGLLDLAKQHPLQSFIVALTLAYALFYGVSSHRMINLWMSSNEYPRRYVVENRRYGLSEPWFSDENVRFFGQVMGLKHHTYG